jgi:Dolichyl-phosphate-mannose-protein mannosyltransferase
VSNTSTLAIHQDGIAESCAKSPTSISRDSYAAPARACIVAAALLLAWWTWAHWGDIQIDCGRELYVPLEILRGKLVYRDFWYPYGPLMPYVEALLVSVFGRHLAVFYLFGLAITIASALLLFELGRTLDNVAIGMTAALALILQSFEPWAFNFIFPYAYAATMGLTFGLLCVLLILNYIFKGSGVYLAFASLAAGLALLCKQEVGIACFSTLAFFVGLEALLRKSMRLLLIRIVQCSPGAALSTVVYGYFFWRLTIAFVLENWLGPPGPYFAAKYGKTLYAGFGMRFVPLEIIALLISAALALRLWYLLAKMCLKPQGRRWLIVIAGLPLLVRVATFSEPWSHSLTWHLLSVFYYIFVYPRGMYFIALSYLLYIIYLIHKSENIDSRLLGQAAVSVFAVTLAVRVMAQVTTLGYSIYYATPLFLVFLLAVNNVIGAAIASDSGQRHAKRNLLLAVEVIALATLIVPVKDWRTAKLETTWGTIYLSPNDAGAARWMLDFISGQKRLGKRVVIVPEAPIMYALTDTEAPSRWYTLLPGFLSTQQEQDYVDELERSEPEYVIVTARNFEEYGSPRFGIDFDRGIFRWLNANYRVIDQVGDFPMGDRQALAAYVYRRQQPLGRARFN